MIVNIQWAVAEQAESKAKNKYKCATKLCYIPQNEIARRNN